MFGGKGGNSAFNNIGNEYAHILDPNERRRLALAEIDKVNFGWSHVRAIVVAGTGFFTDAYDLFAINSVVGMLGIVYWQTPKGHGVMPSSAQTAVKIASPVGAVLGQIVFGHLADRLGRKRIYGVELLIIIVATLTHALCAQSLAFGIVSVVIFWRIILGIGIGGDYPMSAVIMAEFSTTRWRGAMIASVFSMQGFGQLACALVALIVTASFKTELEPIQHVGECGESCQRAVDRMWRIVIGLGAIPGCLALYYRITIPETPRYTFDISRDTYKAERDVGRFLSGKEPAKMDEVQRMEAICYQGKLLRAPRSSFKNFRRYFRQWKHLKLLLGTSLSWLFLDIAFYGLGLNNTAILATIGFNGGKNLYEKLYNNAVGALVLVCAGALPGYWFTIGFVDWMGRKPLQLLGFAALTVIFIIIGFAFHHLSGGGLLALYIVAQFFFNFGPNATTFIYPAELFPTRFRATGHGISAAAGKLGAIIALAFDPLRQRGAPHDCTGNECQPWLNHIMEIFALFMLCGLLSTFLLPETSRRSLEDISGDGGPMDQLPSRNASAASEFQPKDWPYMPVSPQILPRI